MADSPTGREPPTAHEQWVLLHGGQGGTSLEYQTYTSAHPFDTIVAGLRRLGGHLLLGSEPFHRPSLVAGWESAAWSRAKPGSHRSSCTTVESENMRGWEPTSYLMSIKLGAAFAPPLSNYPDG